MSALEELMADNARAAAARFFLHAGRAKGPRCGDEYSLPLFPLPLILEAEGLLAKPTELDRCRALIRALPRDLGAG